MMANIKWKALEPKIREYPILRLVIEYEHGDADHISTSVVNASVVNVTLPSTTIEEAKNGLCDLISDIDAAISELNDIIQGDVQDLRNIEGSAAVMRADITNKFGVFVGFEPKYDCIYDDNFALMKLIKVTFINIDGQEIQFVRD